MNENSKSKIAIYWAAGCGGCDVSVADIDEKILDLVEGAQIIFWPCVMDYKYEHVRQLSSNEIDICLFNGAIRNSENLEMARLLREKSKILVALGSCASLGGIPGLANLSTTDELLDTVYCGSPSTVNDKELRPRPQTEVEEGTLSLPSLLGDVKALTQVVAVDRCLPGCPPTSKSVVGAMETIISGDGDRPSSEPSKILCDSCSREKPQTRSFPKFRRPHQVNMDPEKCFLEQGVICLGPVTKAGCDCRCIEANFPCRGCYGPPADVEDQGGKMVSMLGSLVAVSRDETEADEVPGSMTDLLGTFYSYTLPTSILTPRKDGNEEN